MTWGGFESRIETRVNEQMDETYPVMEYPSNGLPSPPPLAILSVVLKFSLRDSKDVVTSDM